MSHEKGLSDNSELDQCRFAAYTKSMLEIEKAKVKTKAEADEILKKVEPVS